MWRRPTCSITSTGKLDGRGDKTAAAVVAEVLVAEGQVVESGESGESGGVE